MKPKAVQWIAGGLLFAGCVMFVLLRRGGADSLPPLANVLRPADAPPPDPSKIPQVLKLTPTILEFGELVLGEKKTLTVEVENTGKKAVTVYRTVFSCPCVNGGLESTGIPPGQSAKMSVTFTGLPGKRSYHTVGSLISDEEGPCRYDFTVDGKIQQDFLVEPETLQFGKLEKDASTKLDAVVRRRDGKPFTIKEIKASRPEFGFVSEPAPGPANTAYKISVTAKALRPGTLTELASVATGEYSPETSPVLTLAMEVQGDFIADPAIAIAAIGPDGKPVPFEVSIRNRAGAKVHVDSVTEGQGRAVEFGQDAQSDGSARVKAWFKDAFPQGAPFGELLITASGQPEPVHVPYRIELTAAKPRTP
jgi:hypothetical protein